MTDRTKRIILPATIAALAVVLALVLAFRSGDETADSGADGTDTAAKDASAGSNTASDDDRDSTEGDEAKPDYSPSDDPMVRRDDSDPTAMGDVDAPVVMVAYSDFQCPFCGKFARETHPTLIEEYVDKGLLRIEWRDFPYLGDDSYVAADAGRAAAEQDKFWEFHDALFGHEVTPYSGKMDRDLLEKAAGEAGLDVDKFGQDLDSGDMRTAVDEDVDEGQSIGVTGTPAFVIAGTPIMGAQPVDTFRETIDQAIEDAKQ